VAIAVEFAPRERLDLRSPFVDEGKEIRMIRRCCLLLALMLAAVVLPVRAQGGCEDSPEDPTIVLALVGGAGALAASVRAAHSRKR
jgi:XrtJ-associated TM-motif-TM protein